MWRAVDKIGSCAQLVNVRQVAQETVLAGAFSSRSSLLIVSNLRIVLNTVETRTSEFSQGCKGLEMCDPETLEAVRIASLGVLFPRQFHVAACRR
jgi:hypothetical protein